MKHPDQHTADEVHEFPHPQGHGMLDTRRDLHNRSPHAANTPMVGGGSTAPEAMGPQGMTNSAFTPDSTQNY